MIGPLTPNQIAADISYIKFGSLWIPQIHGLDVTAELASNNKDLLSLSLVYNDSIAKVELFAAAKIHNSWTDTRAELAARLEETKVQPKISNGFFGPELSAVMPTFDQSGNAIVQAVKFLGIDGDRWFMRITVSGLAATQDQVMADLNQIISKLVVDRGDEPMSHGSRLMLTFPTDNPQSNNAVRFEL